MHFNSAGSASCRLSNVDSTGNKIDPAFVDMEDLTIEVLAAIIRRHIKENNISQIQFAETIGVHRNTISAILKEDSIANPRLSIVQKIVKECGLEAKIIGRLKI